MKRFLSVLLVLTMILGAAMILTSCLNNENENETDNNENSNDESVGKITVNDLFYGIGSSEIIYSQIDAKIKQEFTDSLRSIGYEVEFKADGTTIITYENGDEYTQKPDGTWKWSVDANGGNEVNFGTKWPDNEFTRIMPKPSSEFELTFAGSEDNNSFQAVFSGGTLAKFMKLKEQVIAGGFTVNPEDESTDDPNGAKYVMYNAEREDGYRIYMLYTIGEMLNYKLEKPNND